MVMQILQFLNDIFKMTHFDHIPVPCVPCVTSNTMHQARPMTDWQQGDLHGAQSPPLRKDLNRESCVESFP